MSRRLRDVFISASRRRGPIVSDMQMPPFTTSCAACHRRIAGEQAERARVAHRPLVICDRCVEEAPEIGSAARRSA
jgi:hypothetical protein